MSKLSDLIATLDGSPRITAAALRAVLNAIKSATVTPEMFSDDDDTAVQQWATYLKSEQAPASINRVYSIATTVDMTGYYGVMSGFGMSRAGFSMLSDNLPILKVGSDTLGGANKHGAKYSDFFAEYVNPQDATKTLSNAIECNYFRHSTIKDVQAANGYRSFYSGNTPSDNHFFSNTLDNLYSRKASYRHYQFSSGTATGNTGCRIGNLYAVGERANVAGAECDAAYVFERMSDGEIGQLNAEWMTCKNAIVLNRCSPRIAGLHLEGLSASTENDAFVYMIGSIADVTVRAKTLNFSGGDPETGTQGSISTFSLLRLEQEVGYRGSHLEIRGSNASCTPALTNTYLASSVDGWAYYQSLDMPVWIDEDGILESGGEALTSFASPPEAPYWPILRQYNNLRYGQVSA